METGNWKLEIGNRKLKPCAMFALMAICLLPICLSAAQEKPPAPEKPPVISEATLHRFWHAAYSLDQAQTQLKRAQDEFAAVRQEIDAACGNNVVNINPRTSEPTCGGPRTLPEPAPTPKKEPKK